MLPHPVGIKPVTSLSPVECAADWATEAGTQSGNNNQPLCRWLKFFQAYSKVDAAKSDQTESTGWYESLQGTYKVHFPMLRLTQ